MLVAIGSHKLENKELIALNDGYRESAASWEEMLLDMTQRGLKVAPKIAVGDGALGFWKALDKFGLTPFTNDVGYARLPMLWKNYLVGPD